MLGLPHKPHIEFQQEVQAENPLEMPVFALLILAVGACEVAVALAVIIQRFKLKQQPFTDELNSKRE